MALLPLSYAQRSLWLLHQFAPEGGAYNVNIPLRIRSACDEGHLVRCLRRLLERHEMLRARYVFDGRQLGYEILPSVNWDLQRISLSPTLSDEELNATVSRYSHRVFELDKAPVFRVFLFKIAENDHVFLFSTHHINGDLFSITQFMEELFTLYASADPENEPLLPVEATFAEHVTEQQSFLESEEGQRQWAYWSSCLQEPLPRLDLRPDFVRPRVQSHNGAMLVAALPADHTARIKAMASSEKATFFSVLLSMFYATVHRISGQHDLIVGTPVPGRRGQSRFERVMGTFVNVMPLRVSIEPSTSFRALLGQVTQTLKDARKNQDYPFPLLVEKLRIPRDTSRTPIFQTYFTLQRLGQRPERLSFFLPMSSSHQETIGTLQVGTVPLPQQEGQLELAVHVYDINDALFVEFKYNTDLFKRATVEGFQERFFRIAEQVLSAPEALLSELSLAVHSQGGRAC
jgi:NRPS condensation-like uncharacterized protein